MKKTCYNCRYFYTTLINRSSDYHIHNWCAYKERILKSKYWDKKFAKIKYEDLYFDDFETGYAKCKHFEENQMGNSHDEWIKNNERLNKKFYKQNKRGKA